MHFSFSYVKTGCLDLSLHFAAVVVLLKSN